MGSTRRSRTLDVLALAWVTLWVVVAVALGSAAWGLGDVTDAARQAASGTDQAGRAVQQLGDLPLVPNRVGELGGSIRDSAVRLDEQAAQARTSIHRLAVGLAVAVFAVATAPVWLVHLPLRARRARAAATVRAFLGASADDGPDGGPGVGPGGGRPDGRAAAWLAQRAVVHLPPARLLAITHDPAGDLAAGRHHALARAELVRLGVDPRALGEAPAGRARPSGPAAHRDAPGRTAAGTSADATDTSWGAGR